MLPDAVANDPDGLALDDLTRSRSWAELVDRATRAGHLFRDTYGIAPGGHVAMLMGNRVELVELVIGALVLAAAWLTADQLAPHRRARSRYILDDSGSTILFTDPEHEARAQPRPRADHDVSVVVAGPELDGRWPRPRDEPFPLDGPGGGTMLYTSRHHRAAQGREARGASRAGRRPWPLGGAAGHARSASTARARTSSPVRSTTPRRWASRPSTCQRRRAGDHAAVGRAASASQLIQERAVRNSHLVPTMFVRLLRLPEEERAAFDASSLRTVLHGAAPIAPPVKHRMIEWWGPVLVEYWGSTEGGVFTLVDSTAWLDQARHGRAGPSPATRCSRSTPTASALPAGEVGTLYTPQPRHRRGVRVPPRARRRRRPPTCAPGTFTMGDVGQVDDGRLRVPRPTGPPT